MKRWEFREGHMPELDQWIIGTVLVIGGRDYIIPQEAIYTGYISGIYCQLGDYMLPTIYYQNHNNPLTGGARQMFQKITLDLFL